MSTPDDRGYEYLFNYSNKPKINDEPTPDADVQQVVAFTQPRDLNPELSQAVYYDSERLKITIETLKKYLSAYLFEKFPGTGNKNIQSAREFLVREICHIFVDFVKEGRNDPAITKLNPVEYKEWQVAQVVRAIQKVKFSTSDAIKKPVITQPKEPTNSPYFDEELPHEKVITLASLVLKMQMIDALLK